MVMDTLGLHVFGLPDVQCHFRDREPGEIATMLFSTAVYLFRSGDVIADGNTISGPQGTSGSSASTSAPYSRPAARSSMSILAIRTRPASGIGVASVCCEQLSILSGPEHTAY